MNDFIKYLRTINIYKKAFWLYLILLFVEGMFRKWFMPGASNFWMIVREPIVIWLVIVGFYKGWIKSPVAIAFMVIGVVSFITTMIFGHQNLFIALYGLRIWLFHMPFIFVMAYILDKRDLKRILQFLVFVFILATPLFLMQFFSPPNTIWNATVGGEISDAEMAANGAVRPSGFFANGVSSAYFNPLMFSILLAVYFSSYYRKFINPSVFLLFLVGIAVTLVTSVSRGTVIQSIITLVVVSVWLQVAGAKNNLWKILGVILILVVFINLFQSTEYGARLLAPITYRFESAAESEGGTKGIFISRVIGPYLWYKTPDLSLFGKGLGLSSNFAAQTLTGGYNFILGEWSSQQITGEMGLILGTIIFFLKIGLLVYLIKRSYIAARYRKEYLPIALWPFVFTSFANGHYNLTSTLGFIVLGMILLLLSLKTNRNAYSKNRVFRHS